MALFKYYTNNNYTYNLFDKGEIFLSSISTLNDPFEMLFKLSSDAPKERKEKRWNVEEFNEKGIQVNIDMMDSYMNTNLRYIQSDYKNKYENYGLFCLTSNPHDILMWSYYGDSHQGVCVEFDKEKLTEYFDSPPIEVEYVKQLPEFNFYSNDFNPIDVLKYKSKHWSHEKELRFIIGRNGIETIPLECIRSITPGLRYYDNIINNEEIKDVLALVNTKAELKHIMFNFIEQDSNRYALNKIKNHF